MAFLPHPIYPIPNLTPRQRQSTGRGWEGGHWVWTMSCCPLVGPEVGRERELDRKETVGKERPQDPYSDWPGQWWDMESVVIVGGPRSPPG